MLPSLLVIDIGNSSIASGIFLLSSPKNPSKIWTTPTGSLSPRAFVRRLKRKCPPQTVAGVCLSSVVPHMDKALRKILRSAGYQRVLFVTPKTPSRIINRTRNPSEVGADRLANARAVIEHNSESSIVVDFGTATTFDCIQKGGLYLGGVIAPGPVISSEALFARTAKLPRVILKKPAALLGRNTTEAIESGLYHGYRGLVTEIVARLKEKMGPRTKVFATGGQARWILNTLRLIDYFDPHLTLRGLAFYWKDQLI